LNAVDDKIAAGAFAFYSWKNSGAGFSDVDVVQLRVITDVEEAITIENEYYAIQDNTRVLKMSISYGEEIRVLKLQAQRQDGLYDAIAEEILPADSQKGVIHLRFVDKKPWLHSRYRLLVQNIKGETVASRELTAMDGFEKDFALLPSYPNPFSDQTTLQFHSSRAAAMEYRIYNILGQLVLSGETQQAGPGFSQMRWDGRDALQRPAPNGIYFIQIHIMDVMNSDHVVKSLRHKIVLAR
jgi:hypothetical protein